ncbi:MAG: hypothetical protein WBP72_07500, partial [Rhodocyclaceae bacterium]
MSARLGERGGAARLRFRTAALVDDGKLCRIGLLTQFGQVRQSGACNGESARNLSWRRRSAARSGAVRVFNGRLRSALGLQLVRFLAL